MRGYQKDLELDAVRIGTFEATRKNAFNEELERWRQSESITFTRATPPSVAPVTDTDLAGETITCPISASVWKVLVDDSESVEEGQEIAVLESMKTEVPLIASASGRITVLVVEGQTVAAGDPVAVVATAV